MYEARTGTKFASFAQAAGVREPCTRKISNARFFREFDFEIEKLFSMRVLIPVMSQAKPSRESAADSGTPTVQVVKMKSVIHVANCFEMESW